MKATESTATPHQLRCPVKRQLKALSQGKHHVSIESNALHAHTLLATRRSIVVPHLGIQYIIQLTHIITYFILQKYDFYF